MEPNLLAIYVTDHVAGSAAGTRRSKRLAAAERSSPDGPLLSTLADEIEIDRQRLLAVLEREGIAVRRFKCAVARIAETIGLLKTNGRMFRRSPLSTLVELEGLKMGVTAKRGLWVTLDQNLAGHDDFADLIARADDQLATLDDVHQRRGAALAVEPSAPA